MTTNRSNLLRLLPALVCAATVGTAAQSGPDLSGTWLLDTYLSDSPAQAAAVIRLGVGQGGGNRIFGGDEPEGGRSGRGGGGYGRRGPQRQPQGGQEKPPSLEEQNRLDELTKGVRYPATTLTISQSGDAISLGEGQEKRTLTASGKREKISIGQNEVNTTTRWEGPLLVSEADFGKGIRMITTYGLAPTKQLVVKVRFERGLGETGPFEIKYVYDRSS